MLDVIRETDDWVLGRWACGEHPGAAEEHVPLHEVVIPVSGAYARERAGVERLATPNMALLADRGDTYRVRHPVGGGDESVVLMLRDHALEDLGRAVGVVRGESVPRFRRYAVPLSSRAFLAAITLTWRGRRPDPLAVESGVAVVLERLFTGADADTEEPGPAVATRHQRAVRRAMEYMAANYRSSIGLDDIAAAAAYSPFHFARVFRRVTGASPYQAVLQLRLRAAVALLEQGTADLSAVAFKVGFSSHSHMSAAFRNAFGRSPSVIRARF